MTQSFSVVLQQRSSRGAMLKAMVHFWIERMQKWIRAHFPQDTGLMRETACLAAETTAVASGKTIYFDLWDQTPEYAVRVEKMEGVNWSNPDTVEHPYFNGRLEGFAIWDQMYIDAYAMGVV